MKPKFQKGDVVQVVASGVQGVVRSVDEEKDLYLVAQPGFRGHYTRVMLKSVPAQGAIFDLRNPPDTGLEAPNEECKNNLDRICLIIDQYVEQNVTDAENAMLDLVTDCLIANRFLYGAAPDDLLDRAQRAYFSQLADAGVWA